MVFLSGSLSLEEAGGGEAAETLISYEINVKIEKEKKKRTLWEICKVDEREFRADRAAVTRLCLTQTSHKRSAPVLVLRDR